MPGPGPWAEAILDQTERRNLDFTVHLLFTLRLAMVSAGDAASRSEGSAQNSADARNAEEAVMPTWGLPSEGLQIVVYPKDIGLIRLYFAGDANSELSLQSGFPE